MTECNIHQSGKHDDQEPTRSLGSFTFDGRRLHLALIDENGTPWFVARQVLLILGLKGRSSLAALEDDDKRVHSMDTNRGPRDFTLVSEAGLYLLIMRSRKPAAKRFTRWVTGQVLPEIRRTGSYARPGIVPRDPAVQELLELQRQLLAVEQEKLDLERAKMALARFPEVSDLERGAVRGKLTQMVEAVAMIRGRCSGPIWRELYLAVKAINHIDLYAQQAAARKLNNRVGSIIQCVDKWGLLDMVYTTARRHFMDEILAKPVNKRLPELHVDERLLPTAEDRMAELTFDFAMGRPGDEAEPDSLN